MGNSVARHWFSALLVAVSVATMIALGVWQLQRSTEKAALRQIYAANQRQPVVPLRSLDFNDPATLFRQVEAQCGRPIAISVDAGRGADGAAGWRHIATCAADEAQPEILVDVGVSPTPDGFARWTGGSVTGLLITEPQRHGLISRLMGQGPPARPMIVAAQPAPGLAASAPPDPLTITDNHLSYAVQWFLFAVAAGVIYLLALRQRLRAIGKTLQEG